jgi:large subunit ribosomal protein L13
MSRNIKTPILTKEEVKNNRQWYVFDATGKTLGRFAAEIAKILRGKHKTTFTPHIDGGDGVIVLNAGKVYVSGSKPAQKVYRHYTGSIGGMREISYQTMLEKKPEQIIFHAVRGMLPKTKLGRQQLKKLRVYNDDKHDMQAQKPISVNI